MNFVLRLFVVTVGVLLAASLAVAFGVMLAFWTVRAGWAKLRGRPIVPFIRIDPRSGFERMYRRAGAARRGDRVRLSPNIADVTDVEPRPPS